MLPPVPEYIRKLIPYEPGKPIEELERELGISGSIKLASNENPVGPSPRVVEAIMQNAPKINFYPDGDSFYLKAALAAHLGLSREAPTAQTNVWPVCIRRRVFQGDFTQYQVDWEDRQLVVRCTAADPLDEGEQAYLTVDPHRCVLLEPESSAA